MRISDWSSDVCSSDLEIPHCAVRPAWLRQIDAACRTAREHDLGSGRRHGADPGAARYRAMARVRWLLGIDAGPDLCRYASARLSCSGTPLHLPFAQGRERLVLPTGSTLESPRF